MFSSSVFYLQNTFFKVIIYENAFFPKIHVFFNNIIIFNNFSGFITSCWLTENLPPLFCLYLLNFRSRGSLWKGAVRTYLYPSLNNYDSKQRIAFSAVIRTCDLFFLSEKFGQVDHYFINLAKVNRNSGLLSLQKTAFASILEVLYCVLALHKAKSFWNVKRKQAASDFSRK